MRSVKLGHKHNKIAWSIAAAGLLWCVEGVAMAQDAPAPAEAISPTEVDFDATSTEEEPNVSEDEVEETVETVKLGGEDRIPEPQEGVEKAETYEKTADPNSPLNVEITSGAEVEPEPIQPPSPAVAEEDPTVHDPSRVAYATTRRNARTMSLTVPGPRGLITDRNGLIMACSEIAYQPTINFGQLQDESEASIIATARKVMSEYEALGLTLMEKKDEQLVDHYRNRRWLPLPIGPTVRESEIAANRQKLESIKHSHLMPIYIRNYPAKMSACHILGYTGAQAKLPTGPINHNDPIFQKQEGRSGLEKEFNKQLTGHPGIWRLMFDEQGNKILDELQTKPRPGGTLVTTLNLNWQKAAEKALRENTKGRGAFAMVDVHTGEVLVLASVPNFDPNCFVPAISQKDYDALRNDKNTPLVSRAFAGVYPPASTFKTITVAAALRYNVIQESTYINCPFSVRIGGHHFRNHSKFTGSINCITALVLSNNPFMYQVAATRDPRIGAARLCETARRFGFGAKAGLPIPDKAGNVPDEGWMFRNYGRGFMAGDAANMAIGQGPLLATPLQVAHAIAGIANGKYLPKLQLVRQMLDPNGNVVFQFTPTVQNNLKDMASAMASVRKGMRAVVNGGTGRRAALSYVSNAGKTGTAQWGPASEDCRLAWFAGFLPADNPRYAYAALYEGRPHQRISGGHMAAAIVKNFFENIRSSMEVALKDPTKELQQATSAEETEEPSEEDAEAKAAEEAHQQQLEAARRKKQEAAKKRHQQSGWDDGRSRR